MLRTEELTKYRSFSTYKAYLVTGEEQCLLWERIEEGEVVSEDLGDGQMEFKIISHPYPPSFLDLLEKEEILAGGHLKVIDPETAKLFLNSLNNHYHPERESIADELWEDDDEVPIWDPTVKASTAEFGISLSQSEEEEQEKHRQWLMLQQVQD